MTNLARKCAAAAFAVAFSLSTYAASPAAGDEFGKRLAALPWQTAGAGQIAGKAEIKIPQGERFLGDQDGTKLLELLGNLPSPGTSVLVLGNAFATFDYQDDGLVKDDEKLDAAKLLQSLRDFEPIDNEARTKAGLATYKVIGWAVPPHYEQSTNTVEWGVRLRFAGATTDTINYSVRLLGRGGVINATLVSDTESLPQDLAMFRSNLQGFSFLPGQKYSEWKPGDKVAAYGLSALVLGGAAAAATKGGLWKVFAGVLAAGWKVVVGLVIALIAGIGKLFGARRKSAA